jgi:putative FmdB family regulatory protein
MPTYDYLCESCSHEINDLYQSFSEDSLIKCPSCGQDSLRRVIYGGLGTFVKDVKTIGQLADKNWKSMGRYKKSEIEQQRKDAAKSQESPLSSLGKASRTEINKMTQEQKHKYIITGET